MKRGTVKVSCLAQENNTGQGLKPDSWGLESGALPMKPLQLLNRKGSSKCAHGRSMKIRRVEKVTFEFQQGWWRVKKYLIRRGYGYFR